MPKTKASMRTEKASEARWKPSADQADPRADAAARAADGAAARARARARRVRCRVACHLRSHLRHARRLGTACDAARAAHMRVSPTLARAYRTHTAQTARSKRNHEGGGTLPPTKPSRNGSSSRPWSARPWRRLYSSRSVCVMPER